MIKMLGEVFEDLSFGPLSNMSIGEDGIGSIPVAQHSRVTALVNQGLIRIYSRFLLLEKELTIRAIDGKSIYPLRVKHADQNTDVMNIGAPKFIADTAENPFSEDFIRLLIAYGPDPDKPGEMMEYPVNDLNSELSLFTPSPDVIQLPSMIEGEEVNILYQARHIQVLPGNLGQYIYLPEPLYEALEAYVAHKIFSGMNGQEHVAQGAQNLARYDEICGRVTVEDLAKNSIVGETTKLEYRGFV